MQRSARQLELTFPTWGGRRPRAGRRPKHGKPGVSHAARPKLASRYPVHVSLKVRREVGKLRNKVGYRVVRKSLVAGCQREGFRVVDFSIQRNHIHMVVEAKDAAHLSRGIQGLSIRIARGLNRKLQRAGKVFADRYFARILKTPREVRNCLAYVLNNGLHHAGRYGKPVGWQDSFSSWAWFDGWQERLGWSQRRSRGGRSPPVAEPQTWLRRVGWRRYGLIRVHEIPGTTQVRR